MAPTAAERAEARRKAILARGSDRLAKLTTSARGDEPAFIHDERPPPGRPANLSAFMGEDSPLPPPKPSSTTSTTTSTTSTATRPTSFSRVPSTAASSTLGGRSANISTTGDDDPSAWSQSQQDHFMRALMGAGLAGAGVGAPGVATPQIGNGGSIEPGVDSAQQDPMMQLMSSLMGGQAGAGGPGASPFGPPGASPFGGPGMNMGMAPPPAKQKTIVQKILPVVHVLATFALMVYFILFVEPKAHGEESVGPWARWNELRREPGQWGWSLKTVPFFTAFITLEIVLQSIRIATGLDSAQLPGLLNMALPMLPPPIPSIVRNGLRYAQIFTVMLDDIAAVIVALGLVIWVSGYISV